jgi:hypothetical protein
VSADPIGAPRSLLEADHIAFEEVGGAGEFVEDKAARRCGRVLEGDPVLRGGLDCAIRTLLPARYCNIALAPPRSGLEGRSSGGTGNAIWSILRDACFAGSSG